MCAETEETRIRQFLYRVCPHWYREVPNYDLSIMADVTKRERCRICGNTRVHIKTPEPHPSRSKEDLVDEMQHPGYEVVVEEWLPYGSKGP